MTHRHRTLHALAVAAAAALSAFMLTAAGDPSIDIHQSTVIATFREENVPVDAPFKRFNGQVDYDPAHPDAARARIQVMTESLDLGSADYDAEVRKPDWLDSARYPTATFTSTAITSTAAGQLNVTGTLSLKGRTATVTVPVKVRPIARSTAFDGVFEISRKGFGIGSPDWNSVLDDTVRVRFHIVE